LLGLVVVVVRLVSFQTYPLSYTRMIKDIVIIIHDIAE
jgi:hypothetical protein